MPASKTSDASHLRVLYSFPHAIGRPGIGTTAWFQVDGVRNAGAAVVLSCTSVARPFPPDVKVLKSLSLGRLRVPHTALGVNRALAWHDKVTARWLQKHANEIDAVHVWPSGALSTIRAARRLGVPVFREVPNAHTRTAYELVAEERKRLGLQPVPGASHTLDPWRLEREEQEFQETDFLLVPSAFVRQSFLDRGFPPERLLQHHYGFDASRFGAVGDAAPDPAEGLQIVFLGSCEPRKGLHHALQAWRDSGAGKRGRFRVCGRFEPGYRESLGDLLTSPGVEETGFVDDPSKLLASCHALVLPTIEEGSALVTYEARASGCLLLVSEASGARCEHGRHGLVHRPGDVATLTEHLRELSDHPARVNELRAGAREGVGELSWEAAGRTLLGRYRDGVAGRNAVQGTA